MFNHILAGLVAGQVCWRMRGANMTKRRLQKWQSPF